jgi:hypothetical protein
MPGRAEIATGSGHSPDAGYSYQAWYLAQDSLAAPADDLLRAEAGELANVLLDDRDALLATPFDVAVVYGAAHMGAVARELFRRHR